MSFNGSLFHHQIEAAEFLVNKKRVLLTHDQGLGKTVTSLAAFEKLKELGKAKRCLIIAEASYLWQWERAIENFTDSPYTTADKKHARSNYKHNTDYTLVSYGIYRNDIQKILLVNWDVVITDEAQIFANNASETSKSLKYHNRKNPSTYRWALTGTAIRNRLENLYSIMYWVDKDFLPPWPFFEKRHIVRVQTGISGYKNLIPLHRHLKHRVHRKTHKDVEGHIPKIVGPVIHTISPDSNYISSEGKLLATLDEVHEDFQLQDYISHSTKSKLGQTFNECKQLLSGPNKCSYLVKEIQKVLEENEENKIVVFSFYKSPLYSLKVLLGNKGIKSVTYTGDESKSDKQRNIGEFANSTRVLLVSNAGSRGLDLPYANYVYHIDVPFTFDILDQRNKRITRLSSLHKSVVINYLITDDSIEKYYLNNTLNQGDLLRAVFDEEKDKVVIKSQTLRQYLNGYRQDRKILHSKKGD